MQPMENKIVFDERSFQRIEKKEKDLGTVYHRSLWKDIVSEIKSNPVAIFAVIFLIIIIVASLLAPLSPYDPNKLDLANKFAAPSMQHPFGCDEYGRDYFTRALYGGRVSLMVGFAAMLVTVSSERPSASFRATSRQAGYAADALYRYFPAAAEYAADDWFLNTILKPA